MITVIGAIGGGSPGLSICEDALQALRNKGKDRLYKDLCLGKLPSEMDNEKFLTYLKATNRVCSPLFAAFVPVNPGRLSDVFLPLSSHCVKRPNFFRSACAIVPDVVSLPIRLITFLPRALRVIFDNSENILHPITDMAVHELMYTVPVPCFIAIKERECFYFSRKPMHESEVKEIFQKNRKEALKQTMTISLYSGIRDPEKVSRFGCGSEDPGFAKALQKITKLCVPIVEQSEKK